MVDILVTGKLYGVLVVIILVVTDKSYGLLGIMVVLVAEVTISSMA